MDMYQSSRNGGSGNRTYPQQMHSTGGFRYAPNGQLTNGPSLFGNTASLNTVFGSGIPPAFSSSGGNQFNFPLRSNRSGIGNSSTNSNRSNSQLTSPNRNLGGNHNYNYGVYSKPTSGGFGQQYYSSMNSMGSSDYHSIPRSNGKQRRSQGQGNSSQGVSRVTASLARTSLEEHETSLDDDNVVSESSPETRYRLMKRGDILSGVTTSEVGNQVATISGNLESGAGSSHSQSNTTNSEQETQDFTGGATSTSSVARSPTTTDPQPTAGSRTPFNNIQQKRTPVTEISEIARFHGLTSEYRLINEVGPPHCPMFTVVLHLGGETYEGVGPSIKKAQLVAATVALEKSTLPKPPPRNNTQRRTFQPWGGHGKGQDYSLLKLAALAEEMNEPLHFVNHPITVVNPFRKVTPVTRVAVHVGERIFSGEGNTFHAAKSMGVMVALKALTKVRKDWEGSNRTQTGSTSNENEEEAENKSPISVVYEMALRRNMFISYDIVKEVGPAHMKVFTIQCKVGEEFTTESDGFTKQQAKKLASELMIAKLKEIPVSGEHSVKVFHRGLQAQAPAKRKSVAPVLKDIQKISVSPISRLVQIAHLRKYKEPEFSTIVSSSGAEDGDEPEIEPQAASHLPQKPNRRYPKLKKPHFAMEVKIGPYVSRGEGPNKKAAKNAAADSALVLLGYPPTEPKGVPKVEGQAAGPIKKRVTSAETPSTSKSTPNVLEIISGRQIVPGILVLRSQELENSTTSKNESEEPEKVSIKVEEAKQFLPKSPSAAPTTVHEAVNKLSYLAQLLGVQLSYSDFPKKNEFLSVVSLGTSPPHVSHGIGSTLDDARNNAALKVLNELSDKGLENDPESPDSPKENRDIPPESQ